MSEIQTDETQPSDFVSSLNLMLDNLENVVIKFQKTLLAMSERIEKLEVLEEPSSTVTSPSMEEHPTEEVRQLTNNVKTSAEIPESTLIWGPEIKQKTSYLKIRFVLGLVTLLIGLSAANLALFQWVEQTGLYYLLGEYAPYVCAYGGFAAMIFGAMLINDFLVLTKILKRKYGADNGITISCEVGREEEKPRVVARGPKNRRKTIAAVPLAVFLFMLCPLIASSIVSYTATVMITPETLETFDLYVDSFDNTKDQWAKVGASPYLDAQDEPNNYVYSPLGGNGSNDGDQVGDFGFEDTNQTGTIVSVRLRVYGHASTSRPNKCYFSVYLWNGSSWIKKMDFKDEASYVWKEVDVSSELNTWDKINGAKIYLRTEDPEDEKRGEHACDAVLLRVNYT